MGGAKGGGWQEKNSDAPVTLLLPLAAPGKILMVIKCPSVTIGLHMPRSDLLNVIFARHHTHL